MEPGLPALPFASYCAACILHDAKQVCVGEGWGGGWGGREREARERERRERETTGYEPFALHAPIQWAV